MTSITRSLLGLLPVEQRRRVTSYAVLLVTGLALRAAGAVLLVPVVRELFGADPSGAWPWVGALAATTVLGWHVDAGVARRGADLGFALLDSAQRAVSEQIALVRLGWFTSDNTATARQAIAATGPALVGLVIYQVTPIASAVLVPLLIALALFAVSWPVAVAALMGVPLLLGAYLGATRTTRSADRSTDLAMRALTERLVEFARTQATLRAARRSAPGQSLAGTALSTQHGASMRLLLLQIPGQLMFSVASQLTLLLLAVTVVRADVSAPTAVALLVVIARYLEAFAALGELSGVVETSAMTLGHITTVLAAPTTPAGTMPVTGAPALELRDVSFGYGDAAVLSHLDLRLEPGTTTAVIGPSGSGKSTLLGLLAGLHSPTAGRVLVDGTDAVSVSRDAVSVVFQEPYLFDGTVGDNVLAGRPSATPEELEQALALARVRHALDTPVGDGGRALSGGERQRVSIARAMIKPAPLLLVDEATSALDTENEAAVVDAMTSDPTPRTRVVVTHRLASIRTADRVLFLEEGRIVEDGPLQELLAADGRVASFWAEQEAASAWSLA